MALGLGLATACEPVPPSDPAVTPGAAVTPSAVVTPSAAVTPGPAVTPSAAVTPGPRDPAIDPPAPWTDAWLDAQALRYLDDPAFRRAQLEASLTNPGNLYARARLSAYGLPEGGWDALPEWVPVARPVDATVIEALAAGREPPLDGATPLWDGERPRSHAAWVALGRRVFFEYPLRPEVFAEHALAHPAVAEAVGLLAAADGTWPGVVVFRDLDARARVGITCALCHAAPDPTAPTGLVEGRARRDLDYGGMRLAYHRDTGAPLPDDLARRMAAWGRGRADITQDDDEDPVAIPDLWGLRGEPYLTAAAILRHAHPAALAIRQETQIIQANRERTRPPRALAWALAAYVYALEPPPRAPAPPDPRAAAGRRTFERACAGCHDGPTGSGAPVPAEAVGTDPALALGRARGTGTYRPSPLVRVAEAAPYLHHGVVPTLEAMLDPRRLRPGYALGAHGPGPIAGHDYGMELSRADRADLLAYLRTM